MIEKRIYNIKYCIVRLNLMGFLIPLRCIRNDIWFWVLGEKRAAEPPFSSITKKKSCHFERSEKSYEININSYDN